MENTSVQPFESLMALTAQGAASYSPVNPSTWSLYTCASPRHIVSSPASQSVSLATMCVNRAYEAMLNGIPRPRSHDLWYIWQERRGLEEEDPGAGRET